MPDYITFRMKNKFPVQEVIPLLKQILSNRNLCILSAPPGAGKTTIVPPALLNESWLRGGKIILLEPRRIAARRAAEYMSEMLNQKCGELVGYRIRTEALVSSRTKLEVITEGILTRMLQSDMELPGTGLVILDEFHERSIHADTALAFLLDVQKNIRPDLRILIMSATPDLRKMTDLLEYPPVITASGKMFPVDTHYLKYTPSKPVEILTAEAVFNALKKESGDILVFLPGKKEIRRTAGILLEKYQNLQDVIIHELYGESPKEQQNAALSPDPLNKRKVILSTSLAETSLTIEGVTVVIDSGLSRVPVYNIKRGMPGLTTVPVSKASADQRRGRAGRLKEGVCYRLWTIEKEQTHPDFTTPEILSVDLTHLALELTKWGTPFGEGLSFIDQPPAAQLTRARSILQMLGAIDNQDRLTRLGNQMADLPMHPRLSAMVLKSKETGSAYQACLLAALLEERELTRSGVNLSEHFRTALENKKEGRLITERSRRYLRSIEGEEERINYLITGRLLALAYPDRLARQKNGRQYQLTGGTVAVLPENNPLINEEFLIIPELDASESMAKIFLAAPVSKQDVLKVFENNITEKHEVIWENNNIRGFKKLVIENLTIHQILYSPSDEEAAECILEQIKLKWPGILPWTKDAKSFRERSEWYRINVLKNSADWPVLTDEHLLSELSQWVGHFLNGIRSGSELDNLNMSYLIRSFHTNEQIAFIEKEVPEALKLPSGSQIKLKYDEGEKPVLAVKIQELFGQTDTPRICQGSISVLVNLLSPAMRPMAITQDLKSFWMNVYPQLLKQMRIKYPKHFWPDDPLSSEPTNKTKRMMNRPGL